MKRSLKYAAIAICALLSVKPVAADFTNGGFEDGSLNGWTTTTNTNPGVTLATPPENTTLGGLNLGVGGVNNTSVVTAAQETGVDTNVGASGSFRYPRYGSYAARVNYAGASTNVNSLSQKMTITAADVDPSDGRAHVRFVVAPVLDNPSHLDFEQPYFFVQVRNVTLNNVLYTTFKYANQPGVPWLSGNGNYQYTNWQLIDVAPSNAELEIGHEVEVLVVAARCSLGGHAGYVYVDGVGPFIPGLASVATGPNAVNAGDTITYTYHYQNGGTAAAADTTLDIVLPDQTKFLSVSAPGANCTTPSVGGTGTVSCNVGTVAAKATGSLTVTVTVDALATGSVNHGNYSIRGSGISPLLGPLVITNVTSGVQYADLEVTNTNNTSALGWGQSTQYTMTVTNRGPENVTGATVTNTFPAQLENISWTCAASAGATCTASGTGNINDSVNIPAGGVVTYTISASVIAGSGSGTINNTASVSPPGGIVDNFSTNDSASDIDAIGTLRTLTVSKNSIAGGRVISSPSGIDCGTSCSTQEASYVDGSSVSLTAIASSGYDFLGWSGACSGTGACVIPMNGAANVTAMFSKPSCSSGSYGPDCAMCPGGGTCSGKGTCDDGVSGSGMCTCVPGFVGADCSQVPPTPTPEVTPTVAPPPVVGDKEIRGRVTVNGEPLAGVVVDGGPLGIAITDANGYFVFTRVPSDRTYSFDLRKTGYTFPESSVSLASGGYAEVAAQSSSFNSGGCEVRETSDRIFAIARTGKKLRNYAVRMADQGLRRLNRAGAHLSADERKYLRSVFRRGKRFERADYLKLMTQQQRLPDVTLVCTQTRAETCQSRQYGATLARMRTALRRMRTQAMFISRKIRDRLAPTAYSQDTQPPAIRRHHSRALGAVNKFPRRSWQCQ